MNLDFKENEYIINTGFISYEGLLLGSKMSTNNLTPIFEAFTNSWEAFTEDQKNREIHIDIYKKKSDMFDALEFEKLMIKDNGEGFNNTNFSRVISYKDMSKGKHNKGSGKIQYLLFFDLTEFNSVYAESNKKYCRKFNLSGNREFLKQNAIIQHKETNETENEKYTSITFNNPISKKILNFYSKLDANKIKEELKKRYLPLFCLQRNNLPNISIREFHNGEEIINIQIASSDIHEFDKQTTITLKYQEVNENGNISQLDETEDFYIYTFKLPVSACDGNAIKLTVKDEIIDKKHLDFRFLLEKEKIEDNRYLVLVSSEYLNNLDQDSRGEFNLPKKSDIQLSNQLIHEKNIFFDELQEKINTQIENWYPEILNYRQEKQKNIEKLKDLFLLDSTLINKAMSIPNPTDQNILELVYKHDAKLEAEGDAEIKKHIEEIESLNPAERDSYTKKLKKLTNKVVSKIPLQNRNALSHYVARRKLVLDLFDKVLEKQLSIQNSSDRNIDERLLHEIIFQQSSVQNNDSDLWLINEDFIYFKGCSDLCLSKVKINDKSLLKEHLTPEEEKYKTKLGIDESRKKPDVLLFPSEGKCIILEFKNPKVNISECLNEINKYAGLIHNLSDSSFNFNTYYGYLIGETIDPDDIRDFDSDFKEAPQFNYMYRPYKLVAGKFDRQDGGIYTEIISYKALLARAKQRNKIFIDKLNLNGNQINE